MKSFPIKGSLCGLLPQTNKRQKNYECLTTKNKPPPPS